MPFDLQVSSVSIRFASARYLRFCSRALTASRAVSTNPIPFSPRDMTFSPQEIVEVFRMDE